MNVLYTPTWMTFEIEQALRGMSCKRHTTVLKLADAFATTGRSMEDVFRDADCCNRSTWHGRTDRPGWKSDPQIQTALKLATERAQQWQDTVITRNIADAQRRLAVASPAAVQRLITLMDSADDPKLQRIVALDILDRTGAGETASKGLPVQGGGVVVYIPDNERNAPTGGAPDTVSGDGG